MLFGLSLNCPASCASSTTSGISPLMVEEQQRRVPVSSQCSACGGEQAGGRAGGIPLLTFLHTGEGSLVKRKEGGAA